MKHHFKTAPILPHRNTFYIFYAFIFPWGNSQPLVGQDLVILDASLSHSVGLLLKSDQLLAETCT
jgi:hypothetical protein